MAKIIMVQGTSSGVGKSIFSTALCRIFKQDGYKVAPFKAQNMSSNFHILENGYKMARSQAICAYACGIEPDFTMNPILLMPKGKDTEIYLNGKYKGTIDGFKYKNIKMEFFDEVLKSFNKLYNENDIVVIEGAGSPVELNLIETDIVNMGFARKVKSPVLLISDITRGGVFASLYGTVKLINEPDRSLIKGLVINKFKGDTKYFKNGEKIIEEICEKDVLGVIPYFQINIEDEDSLTDDGKIKTKESLMENLTEDYMQYLYKQFDLLADNFRKNLNMKKIYKILEEGA
ncbi:MAG: cobyric acid synthase [Eubacteriales bacterium]|nr:cobyric acid synthase [Eubacteriales bacterium]